MTYILMVIILNAGNVTMSMQEFSDKDKCEAAGMFAQKSFVYAGLLETYVRMVCQPK